MIPKPSQPSIIVIMLGDRINRIMEIINIITMWVNRWRWWSPII